LFLTLSRNRSPVAIEESCGNFFMSLSLWVPFPTPGAPTSIILAAFFNFWAVVLKVMVSSSTDTMESGEDAGRDAWGGRPAKDFS
jgi:hypothetical protein